MPMIISFAWTTPALLAGRKTCTRREWKPIYADRFHVGDIVTAYDRNPRQYGHPVAELRLTADPVLESTADAPESDYEAEGFDYLAEIGAKVDGLSPAVLWRAWHLNPQEMWVVRFEWSDCCYSQPSGDRHDHRGDATQYRFHEGTAARLRRPYGDGTHGAVQLQ